MRIFTGETNWANGELVMLVISTRYQEGKPFPIYIGCNLHTHQNIVKPLYLCNRFNCCIIRVKLYAKPLIIN